jgi:ferric-dicitrate binding protein FerR (iron transport regulator)
LAPVGGQVRISLPKKARTFVRLVGPRLVPVGTRVDTNAGAVALTSADPGQPAHLQTGRFHGGTFEIRQSVSQGGLVNLVIRDNLPSRRACATRARLSQRVLGLLRGNTRGRFRTTGRFGSGTVRGTDWGVRDRCDGTLVLVRSGIVDVRDFGLRKDILVRAGHTYLAKAP